MKVQKEVIWLQKWHEMGLEHLGFFFFFFSFLTSDWKGRVAKRKPGWDYIT